MKIRAFAVLVLSVFLFGVLPADAKNKRPNVLFILADDQSPFDLKMYNPASELDTPVLDKLAADGMVFDGAYHMGSFSGAVCTPSRHMIMSGRTVWHIPRGRRTRKDVPANLANNTIAAVFNRAGYATMRTCKQGNSYRAANEKFTVRHDKVKRGGTDETGSAWHAQQVLNYLDERQANKDAKPFMIYYGFSHPHDPRNGKVDLLAKYGAVNHTDKNSLPPANPKQPKLPATYLPAHPFHHGHPGLRDEVRVPGVWGKRDERTIRNELGREFACSENIDIQIGRVLDKLKEMGELENTYIIYTADHGIGVGRHGLAGKQNLYEHTWRVPFIVKGPGIKPGSRVQGNIYLLDTLGTICDLAGIKTPETVEGKSFKPVLQGKKKTVRDVLYGVYCGGTKPGMRSVRKGDWKLIKYDVMNGTVRKIQLFNLKDNPDELLKEHHDPKVVKLTGNTPKPNQVNLAGDPKYAKKLAEMEALLLSEMRRLNDPFRLWDQPDDGLELPKSRPIKRKSDKPNIVVILADDMGFGELQCLNPKRGKIKTPHLDSIAAGGMIFTDAHSGSSVCTPTRYGLLTGRYAWRTRLQKGVLTGGKSLIAKERLTIADMLKQKGYYTAMFGKWHLGMLYDGKHDSRKDVSVGTIVTDGPIDAGGFDEFKGYHHSRQMGLWIENGKITEHIKPIEMLPKLTDAAVKFIDSRKGKKQPFFLYVPWNSPHSPVVPSKQWQGKSELNAHADFVMQTDDSYGKVLKALRDNGMLDNTLIICSSDNGTSAPTAKKAELEKMGHYPSANLRGSKADIWDGGHRVPFIVHWPKVIKPGTKSDKLVCLSDVMATATEITGFELPQTAAEDSISFLPVLKGSSIHKRKDVIHHSVSGYFAIRQGDYKLIMCPGSGGWTKPRPRAILWDKFAAEDKPTVQLYDMTKDLGEQKNLAADMPDKVNALKALLNKQINDGRSTPGAKQANDAKVNMNKSPNSRDKKPLKTKKY